MTDAINPQPVRNLVELDSYDRRTGLLNVIIETPQGSPNKIGYDPEMGLFMLKGVLPAGASFPFDFGFVPSTLGEDGDALDVLVLMDAPTFPGCVVGARLIGVLEAEQTERDRRVERNHRLIAVADKSRRHGDIKSLEDLANALFDEIEHFFASYNTIKGTEFRPLGRSGPDRARQIIEEGQQLFQAELAKKGTADTPEAGRS